MNIIMLKLIRLRVRLSLGGIFIFTIINKISMAVILLVVVLFSVDKSFLGFNYIGVIPYICLLIVINSIRKKKKKANIDKKVKIISNICFL